MNVIALHVIETRGVRREVYELNEYADQHGCPGFSDYPLPVRRHPGNNAILGHPILGYPMSNV